MNARAIWGTTWRLATAVGVLTLVLIALALVGCGDASREDAGDARNANVDKTQPKVTAFNNHYPNVETKCANGAPGWRLFVTTKDSATGNNVLAVQDENCK